MMKKKRKTKTQYQGSNRHGSPLTLNDVTKIRNAYTTAQIEFSQLTLHQLKTIQNEKKITGSRKYALQSIIEQKTKYAENEKKN